MQSFKYLVISVLNVKIQNPGRKIIILWDMGHVTYRLEVIVSKITYHKEITYYTAYIILLGNLQTWPQLTHSLEATLSDYRRLKRYRGTFNPS